MVKRPPPHFRIFCRRADHRRPADIDVLDRLGPRDPRARDRRLEGIEVNDHEVDGRKAEPIQRFHVSGFDRSASSAGMDAGMERLDPPLHHLREPRHRLHWGDGHARVLQSASGSPCGEDFHSHSGQLAAELDHAGLVGDTDECALNLHSQAFRRSGEGASPQPSSANPRTYILARRV